MSGERKTRIQIAIAELALLASVVLLLWFKPLDESLATVGAAVLSLIFLALLPVLWKGSAASASDEEKKRLQDQWRDPEGR